MSMDIFAFSALTLSGPGLLITGYEYGYLCLQCFNTVGWAS